MDVSQAFSIRRVRHHGAPVYIGDVEGVETWTANPDRIVRWLCDGYRFRFNQHRALRQKTVWEDDPDNPGKRRSQRDADGNKILATLGTDPVELTDKQARALFPHLAALPMQVIQHPQRVENTEWWAAVKRRRTCRDRHVPAGAMPRFRSAKAGDLRFGIWYNGGKNAVITRTGRRSGVLVITGQNPVGHRNNQPARWRVQITLRLSADVIPYTSVQVDWATRTVTCISEPPDRNDPKTGTVVGVDRGCSRAVATSDGQFFDMPDTSKLQQDRARHQKAMARSKRIAEREGRNWRTSHRRAEHKRLAAKASTKIANIRRNFADQTSHRLVRDNDIIMFEDLDVRVMTRSARGTIASPGRNVAQKRGLNRAILGSAWTALLDKTTSKAARAGKTVVLVPAHHTSQRCHECGHTAPENRESQAVFRCARCGYTANADTNASRNIRDAGLRGWTSPSVVKGRQTGKGDALPAVPWPKTPALR